MAHGDDYTQACCMQGFVRICWVGGELEGESSRQAKDRSSIRRRRWESKAGRRRKLRGGKLNLQLCQLVWSQGCKFCGDFVSSSAAHMSSPACVGSPF